jgi:hypothetical protein
VKAARAPVPKAKVRLCQPLCRNVHVRDDPRDIHAEAARPPEPKLEFPVLRAGVGRIEQARFGERGLPEREIRTDEAGSRILAVHEDRPLPFVLQRQRRGLDFRKPGGSARRRPARQNRAPHAIGIRILKKRLVDRPDPGITHDDIVIGERDDGGARPQNPGVPGARQSRPGFEDVPQMRVCGTPHLDYGGGRVGRVVVHHNHFVRRRVALRQDRVERSRKVVAPVVGADHDTDVVQSHCWFAVQSLSHSAIADALIIRRGFRAVRSPTTGNGFLHR